MKTLDGITFYVDPQKIKIANKIRAWGGNVVHHIDEVLLPHRSYAVFENHEKRGIRLAAARARLINCVTEEFVHHSIFFDGLQDFNQYAPQFLIDSKICTLNGFSRPLTAKKILVLSENVSGFLPLQYILLRSGAFVSFGFRHIQEFRFDEPEKSFDFVVCISEMPVGTQQTIRQMGVVPVLESYVYDSVITGLEINPEAGDYIPAWYTEN